MLFGKDKLIEFIFSCLLEAVFCDKGWPEFECVQNTIDTLATILKIILDVRLLCFEVVGLLGGCPGMSPLRQIVQGNLRR